MLSLMDVCLSGGMLKGERFMAFVGRGFHDCPIEDLRSPSPPLPHRSRRARRSGCGLDRRWRPFVRRSQSQGCSPRCSPTTASSSTVHS